jgi:hypothetical protein
MCNYCNWEETAEKLAEVLCDHINFGTGTLSDIYNWITAHQHITIYQRVAVANTIAARYRPLRGRRPPSYDRPTARREFSDEDDTDQARIYYQLKAEREARHAAFRPKVIRRRKVNG